MIALAEKAAVQLQGTCLAQYDLGEEIEAAFNDSIFCARLDELVFECVICNWWFEQSEMAEDCGDDWICQECFDEGKDNEPD